MATQQIIRQSKTRLLMPLKIRPCSTKWDSLLDINSGYINLVKFLGGRVPRQHLADSIL